jgi:DNA-binding transcriptional ArsR family regulator
MGKERAMRDFLAAMKALSDENRLRIVVALNGRELCLCQIVELLCLATSTVSKHMSVLQQARLVDARKDGRWTYFRLADVDPPEMVQQATELAVRWLAKDAKVRQDAKRLKDILKTDPEDLCRAQSLCRL